MTQQTQDGPGLGWWPGTISPHFSLNSSGINLVTGATVDASGEKFTIMGHAYIDGKAASKTVSGAGGGTIGLQLGATTFAAAAGATVLRLGLQGVITNSAGPSAQPDGTFGAYKDVTSATDTLTGSAWNTISLDTGTSTVNHGSLIAIVGDMTARGGSDSITTQGISDLAHWWPQCAFHNGTAWGSAGQSYLPLAVITADDGTLITLDESWPITSIVFLSYDGNDTPNEYMMAWTQQNTLKIDAIGGMINGAFGANSDFVIELIEDPENASPTVLESFTEYGERSPQTARGRWGSWLFAEERTLTAGTVYGISVRATGTATISIHNLEFADANYRKFYRGGTRLSRYQRSGGTGAFGTQSTTNIPFFHIRISSIDDGAGGGGGDPVPGTTFSQGMQTL